MRTSRPGQNYDLDHTRSNLSRATMYIHPGDTKRLNPAIFPKAGEPTMAKLDFARRLLGHGHAHADQEEQLRQFEIEAEQRYRSMCGLDEPLAERAKRARYDAEHTPFTASKTW